MANALEYISSLSQMNNENRIYFTRFDRQMERIEQGTKRQPNIYCTQLSAVWRSRLVSETVLRRHE